ncbi:MAG TPA: DNA-formamidopyrimidine glycosylase family protein, partial [Actinomycetota bacterium]|nr:DNA-formamidopyrimidine glycosylase family protein [Actinomycetota bacterium]
MPEGDTVFLAATRMHAALAGQRLVATDFRVSRFATADLSGQVVREVAARGKHLLLRTDAGTTLHTHFKMEGAWHLYRPRERWRGPAFQVRAVL